MKRYIFPLTMFLMISCNIFAQSHLDAFRFSQQDYEGTARFTSMGGAFGALGGDFTSLSLNPAGVGVYRSSELTITPTISYNKVTSDYMNISAKDSRTRFNLSNVGYVGAFLTGREDGLVSLNVGIGYTKAMNYNRKTAMHGNLTNESIVDYLLPKADKFTPGQLGTDQAYSRINAYDWDVVMAYGSGIIFAEGTGYNSPLPAEDRVSQERYTTQSGYSGEYVFSFGGNISNKFYFGATLGIQDISYENYTEYWEFAEKDFIGDLRNLLYEQHYRTSGTGYNGKFGAIYRPVPQLRLGLAIHTPTFYYLTEEYIGYMDAEIYNPDIQDFEIYGDGPANPNLYEYRINSPMRLIASGAYTFGKVGLLSVDYELVPYNGMRLKDRDFRNYFESTNQDIKDFYRAASNIRVGGEAWITNNLAFRAGFIYNQSPDKDYDLSKYTYSVGIGGKFGNFFTDFAYALTTTKDYYFPYVDAPNLVTEKDSRSRFMLTFGFRF